jgi:hypothetical protein
MRVIDETIDMLSEYEELNEVGKCQLLDNLIDIIADLRSKEVEEGWRYSEFVYLCQDIKKIPQPFSTTTSQNAFTDTVETLDVKAITAIGTNKNGDIVLNFLGKRAKVPKATEPTESA